MLKNEKENRISLNQHITMKCEYCNRGFTAVGIGMHYPHCPVKKRFDNEAVAAAASEKHGRKLKEEFSREIDLINRDHDIDLLQQQLTFLQRDLEKKDQELEKKDQFIQEMAKEVKVENNNTININIPHLTMLSEQWKKFIPAYFDHFKGSKPLKMSKDEARSMAVKFIDTIGESDFPEETKRKYVELVNTDASLQNHLYEHLCSEIKVIE